LQEQYSSFIYNLVVAKVEASTFVNFEKFFNTCYKELIPVENGILNILTNEFKPFDENYIFFNKLQVKYDPIKECSTIDKFLNDILANEEDKIVFYEYVGFCLYKEYTFEMALMLVGDGRNGKTKCVELIKRLLGVSNCSAISLYALSKGGSIVAKLFGKLANIASDLEATDLKDTGLIKGLTGQSLQTADRKYLNAIEFTNKEIDPRIIYLFLLNTESF
jgi:putative DNA primase/helicase